MIHWQLLRNVLGVVLLAALTATQASAGELTNAQQKALAEAKGLLRHVQINLEGAQKTAGKGDKPLTGSKKKLTMVRLKGATDNMPKLEAAMAKLPADHAEVEPVAKGVAQAKAGIAALEQRIHGGAAPVEDDAGVKLGHNQEEQLKNARFYLKEMEGLAKQVNDVATQAAAVEDKTTINHRLINGAMATIAKAGERAGYVAGYLEELPANGRGVAAATQRYNNVVAQLKTDAATLQPIHKTLSDLVNPANYPAFEEDYKRLGGLVRLFYDPTTLQTNFAAAIDALTQREPAHAELVRVARLYMPLIQQQTDQGKRIESLGNHFLERYSAFNAAADAEKAVLPDKVRADMNEAATIAEAAVAEQKPLFFTGGIQQQLGFAEEKLALLAVLDAEAAAEIEAEMESLREKIAGQKASLRQLIIEQNPLPNDNYAGEDRDQVVAVAVDAWRHQQPEFDVLTTRIPSQAWERRTRWEYHSGTWYFVDTSRLQVQLIVADDANADLAIIRPVNIIKNHEKGDTLIGTPFYSIDDELQPDAYLKRDKIK